MSGPGRPFLPGQSGNPKGRAKKGQTLTDALVAYGKKNDVTLADGTKISRKRALANKVWRMAIDGDIAAARLVYDRVDGAPRQSMAVDVAGTVASKVDLGRLTSEELARLDEITSKLEGSDG